MKFIQIERFRNDLKSEFAIRSLKFFIFMMRYKILAVFVVIVAAVLIAIFCVQPIEIANKADDTADGGRVGGGLIQFIF